MSFFQRFLRAWRDARTNAQYDFLADTDESWTKEDADLMRALFAGPAGMKLKVRLTNYVVRCAVKATRQTDNHAYHNGIAKGVGMAVNAIEEHMTTDFASPVRNKGKLGEDRELSAIDSAGFQ
jgi:hypothetical protein